MKVLGIHKLRYKNQITLPQKVAEKLSAEEGDRIIFYEEDGAIKAAKGRFEVES